MLPLHFDRIVTVCLNGQLGVLGRLDLKYDTFRQGIHIPRFSPHEKSPRGA